MSVECDLSCCEKYKIRKIKLFVHFIEFSVDYDQKQLEQLFYSDILYD